jgi:hypothetical protein
LLAFLLPVYTGQRCGNILFSFNRWNSTACSLSSWRRSLWLPLAIINWLLRIYVDLRCTVSIFLFFFLIIILFCLPILLWQFLELVLISFSHLINLQFKMSYLRNLISNKRFDLWLWTSWDVRLSRYWFALNFRFLVHLLQHWLSFTQW